PRAISEVPNNDEENCTLVFVTVFHGSCRGAGSDLNGRDRSAVTRSATATGRKGQTGKESDRVARAGGHRQSGAEIAGKQNPGADCRRRHALGEKPGARARTAE